MGVFRVKRGRKEVATQLGEGILDASRLIHGLWSALVFELDHIW